MLCYIFRMREIPWDSEEHVLFVNDQFAGEHIIEFFSKCIFPPDHLTHVISEVHQRGTFLF